MQAAQITLSTIAVGSDSDTKLLTTLAQMGARPLLLHRAGGRCPEDLRPVRRPSRRGARWSKGACCRAHRRQPDHARANWLATTLPSLSGYVTRKDPSSRHHRPDVGQGRSAARTPGNSGWAGSWPGRRLPGGAWSSDWRNWPDSERFFQQAVRWTFPEPTRSSRRSRWLPTWWAIRSRCTPRACALTVPSGICLIPVSRSRAPTAQHMSFSYPRRRRAPIRW